MKGLGTLIAFNMKNEKKPDSFLHLSCMTDRNDARPHVSWVSHLACAWD